MSLLTAPHLLLPSLQLFKFRNQLVAACHGLLHLPGLLLLGPQQALLMYGLISFPIGLIPVTLGVFQFSSKSVGVRIRLLRLLSSYNVLVAGLVGRGNSLAPNSVVLLKPGILAKSRSKHQLKTLIPTRDSSNAQVIFLV